jgi:hypothetical protein
MAFGQEETAVKSTMKEFGKYVEREKESEFEITRVQMFDSQFFDEYVQLFGNVYYRDLCVKDTSCMGFIFLVYEKCKKEFVNSGLKNT